MHLETHAMGELFFFHLLQAPVAHIHTLEELEILIQTDDLIEWRVCGVAIEICSAQSAPGNMKDKIVLHCFKPEGPGSLQATVFLIHASEHVITNVRISLWINQSYCPTWYVSIISTRWHALGFRRQQILVCANLLTGYHGTCSDHTGRWPPSHVIGHCSGGHRGSTTRSPTKWYRLSRRESDCCLRPLADRIAPMQWGILQPSTAQDCRRREGPYRYLAHTARLHPRWPFALHDISPQTHARRHGDGCDERRNAPAPPTPPPTSPPSCSAAPATAQHPPPLLPPLGD